MCTILVGYRKFIFDHLIKNVNPVPKIANSITERKKSIIVCRVDSSNGTILNKLFIHLFSI